MRNSLFPLCFRVAETGNPLILVGIVMFPSCFLNGNVSSCFRYISGCGFTLLSVSVTFPHTDSNNLF